MEVQTVAFVKKTSGEGGDLSPPPEPPVIDRHGLSVPSSPHGIKVTPGLRHSPRASSQFGLSRACGVVTPVYTFGGRSEELYLSDEVEYARQ